MKRVINIDGITLDNPCFISSEFNIDDYIGERSIAIDGSSVMFVQAKGSMSKEVQIESKSSGWITKDTKDLLISTADELAKIVLFNDGSQATYYYDHTKTPMRFQSLFEGSLWYTMEINLIKG